MSLFYELREKYWPSGLGWTVRQAKFIFLLVMLNSPAIINYATDVLAVWQFETLATPSIAPDPIHSRKLFCISCVEW